MSATDPETKLLEAIEPFLEKLSDEEIEVRIVAMQKARDVSSP